MERSRANCPNTARDHPISDTVQETSTEIVDDKKNEGEEGNPCNSKIASSPADPIQLINCNISDITSNDKGLDTPNLERKGDRSEDKNIPSKEDIVALKKTLNKELTILKIKNKRINKLLEIYEASNNNTLFVIDEVISDDEPITLTRRQLREITERQCDKIKQMYQPKTPIEKGPEPPQQALLQVPKAIEVIKTDNNIILQVRKEPKVPTFKGEPEEVAQYLAALDNLKASLVEERVEDPDGWILRKVSGALEGRTQIWFREILKRRSPPPPRTLEEYTKEVKEFFLSHVPRTTRLERLSLVRQGPKENIQAYAQRFSIALGELGLKEEDEGSKIAFIHGLAQGDTKRNVSKWLNTASEDVSWHQLVKITVAKERQSSATMLKDLSFPQAAPMMDSEGKELRNAIKELRGEIELLRRKGDEVRPRDVKRSTYPPCKICKKTNHSEEDCFFKNKGKEGMKRKANDENAPLQTSNKREKRDISEIICHKCKEKGHYAWGCPTKKVATEEKPLREVKEDDIRSFLRQALKEELAALNTNTNNNNNKEPSSNYTDQILSEKKEGRKRKHKKQKRKPIKSRVKRVHERTPKMHKLRKKKITQLMNILRKKTGTPTEEELEKVEITTELPNEESVGGIENAPEPNKKKKKWTAAFAMLVVKSRSVRTLIDTGASHSVVALSWLKYLKLDHLIKKTKAQMVDAQKVRIPIVGTVTIPVEFGNKTFDWKFRVSENLICPMIVGMNILHEAVIKMKNRKVKIGDQSVPIWITLEELHQHAIVSAINKIIPPYSVVNMLGRVIKNHDGELRNKTQYVVNSNNDVLNDQLIESYIEQHSLTKEDIEYVNLKIVNETPRKLKVIKGDILAFAEQLTVEDTERVCAITEEIAMQNIQQLMKSEVTVSDSEQKEADTKLLTPSHGPNNNNKTKNRPKTKKENHPEVRNVKLYEDPENIEKRMHEKTVSAFKSCLEVQPTHNSEAVVEDLERIKSSITGAGATEEIVESNMAIGKEDGFLHLRDHPNSTITCNTPKTLSAVRLQSTLETTISEETLGQRSTTIEEDPKELQYDSLSTLSQEKLDSYDEKDLVKWLDSDQILPMGKDGPVVQEKVDSTQQYIESTLRRDKESGKTKETITDEQIKELVKDSNITEKEKEQLIDLLKRFKAQMSAGFSDKNPAGSSFFIPHKIKLTHNNPIWTPQYRRSYKEEDILNEQALDLFKQGVIERTTTSEYNSPAMVVPKKDGTWRTVIDYRNINKDTIKEYWPITRTDEAIDSLHKAKFITKIDCTSGYWQIPLDGKSKRLTAFSTKDGRWQYKSLPMGITNAAPTFQKNMEIMLAGLLWKNCIVYIDDIIVYSDTFEEHLIHLNQVLERLQKVNITIKPSKCFFCRSEVEYLGHIVGNNVQRPTEENVKKVLECKMPTTNTEIKQFCNMAGFYRKFIKHYAEKARPLTDLSNAQGKNVKVTLTKEAEKAFHKIKKAISKHPVLTLPDVTKPFGIRTDASDYAIGGVLFQLDENNQEKPIAFGSRVLSKTERRYSTSEREMLAIYHFIRHWRAYVWGTPFKAYTDHSPLQGIKTKKDVTRRLTRMILNLQDYDFTLYYTPGRLNTVADALSREPFAAKAEEQCNTILKEEEKEETFSPWELLVLSVMEEEISNNDKEKISKGVVSASEKEQARLWFEKLDKMDDPFDIPSAEMALMQARDVTLQKCIEKALKDATGTKWIIKDECVFHTRKQRQKKEKSLQLVLPKCLREDIMKSHHDDLLGGHCGYLKTINKIAQWYWWPKMKSDIKEWVQTCKICQTHSRDYGPKKGKLAPVIAKYPFQLMGMDILTSLPVTERGNRSIVLFTDYYTKWVEAFAIPNEEAITVANRLIKGVICRHGPPTATISDRGVQFTSDVFREVTEMLGVKQRLTTSYNPMGDGQAEKAIGTLTNTLSKLVGSNPNDWDLMIPYALWAYRTAKHAVTKETPYFLIYGRDPVDPLDVRVKHWLNKHANNKIENYTREITQRLQEAKERVDIEVKKAKKAQKERFDKGRIDNPFKVNDLVWWKEDKKTPDENRKLKAKYRGPYKITQVISKGEHNLNVEITHLNNVEDKNIVSIRKLKLAKLRPSQIGDLPIELTKEKEPEEVKPIQKPIEIENPKGRTFYTQQRRKNKSAKKKDIRDEWEVEGITKEREKDGVKEYQVKWVGYKRPTWEPASNMENAKDIIEKWNLKRKLAEAEKKTNPRPTKRRRK